MVGVDLLVMSQVLLVAAGCKYQMGPVVGANQQSELILLLLVLAMMLENCVEADAVLITMVRK